MSVLAPVLTAYRSGSGWIVWCSFCMAWHHHGDADGSPGGRRVAHCWHDGSPYQRTGYVLAPTDEPAPSRRQRRIACRNDAKCHCQRAAA